MRTILLGIQWAIFILALSVTAPLSIGSAFHFSPQEIGELMQRTFFVIGLTTLIQVYFGHKLQIPEGAAGLWWGVFLIFSNLIINNNSYIILQSLEMGLLISGIIFLILGLTKTVSKIQLIFTPIVTGTYLILLIFQLSSSFIKGILGIGYLGPYLNIKVSIISIITLVISFAMARSTNNKIRSFAVLFTIIIGWILFSIFKITKNYSIEVNSLISLPKLFSWGNPHFDIGVIIVSSVTALLLLSNLIASIDVIKRITKDEGGNYNKSTTIMGINHILASMFCTIGFVPVSASAGFIETTRVEDKRYFILGSIIVLIISFFPSVTMFATLLPLPVAYIAMFYPFINILGMGLREYSTNGLNQDNIFIIGVSLMVGVGTMFIPSEALTHLPNYVMPVLSNGLIMGVITCILLEQYIKNKTKK